MSSVNFEYGIFPEPSSLYSYAHNKHLVYFDPNYLEDNNNNYLLNFPLQALWARHIFEPRFRRCRFLFPCIVICSGAVIVRTCLLSSISSHESSCQLAVWHVKDGYHREYTFHSFGCFHRLVVKHFHREIDTNIFICARMMDGVKFEYRLHIFQ